VTATPADGYMFTNWTQNGNVVSTDASYTFNVTGNVSLVANFTEGVMIGSGTTTNEYLPSYNYYKYTLSEQIYTSTELGSAGAITSIAFYNDGAEKTRTYDFYLKATTKSSFTGATDWITVSSSDKVFSGSVTMVAGDWTTITLSSPFVYDGTSNLVLVADDNSGEYTYSPHMACRVFTASNQALYYYDDSNNFNPMSPPTTSGTYNSVLSVKNQIIITKEAISTEPVNITVSANPAEAATVTGGGEYTFGQTCTVTATPTTGYTFTGWTENGTVVSSDLSYSFTATSDRDLVANFIQAIEIGTASSTNNYLPTYNYYNNSLTEQIYTAAEIGAAGTITSIAFYNGGTEKTRTLDFYLKNTTKTSFSSTTDWITVAASDKVFSGSVTMTADDWTVITFSSPFVYDGTSNVVLVTDDNTGEYSNSPHMACRVFDAASQALYTYSDGTNYSPSSPSSYTGTVLSVKNQLLITKEAISTEPVYITVSVSPAQAGTVSGGGEYIFGDVCTVSVTPNDGYFFTGWTENGAVVSNDLEYSFSATSDRDLVATFVQGVEIGEFTTNNTYLPSYNFYNYSLTQQIYTAEEIGSAGTINWIAFYNEGTEKTRTYDFYLKATEKTSFSSNDDWITVTDSDKVFSGSVTMAVGTWTIINFTTPFEYDGISNLVLVADDNSGAYTSSPHMTCSVFNTDEDQAIYIYNDNTDFDPMSPPAASTNNDVLSVKNHILLGISNVMTFTKDILGYGTGTGNWYLIASPLAEAVDPTDVENLINNENGYDLFRFNQAAEEEWENYKNHGFMLEPGQGYLYANSETVELVFTGIPYNGNCEVELTNDESASEDMRGWNLVGNPFNEDCYIADGRDFYVMNEGGEELFVGCEYLNPMEGGFVYAEWDFDVITLTNTNPAGAKSANVSLNLSNGNAVIDRAIVRFGEGRQLPKFQLRSSSTKLAIAQNDSEYAVVRSGNEGEMPVNFKAEKSGTYTISVNSENVEFGYLHLFDNMTGNDIDLLADPSYTFEAKTTDYASRFRLVFSAETETESFAYFNGSEWVVNGTGTMQMVDMTGRVLSSENVTGIATVNTNKLSAGVYVMRLVNGNDVKTQKIVVR
jgi:hypothetical protein